MKQNILNVNFVQMPTGKKKKLPQFSCIIFMKIIKISMRSSRIAHAIGTSLCPPNKQEFVKKTLNFTRNEVL